MRRSSKFLTLSGGALFGYLSAHARNLALEWLVMARKSDWPALRKVYVANARKDWHRAMSLMKQARIEYPNQRSV